MVNLLPIDGTALYNTGWLTSSESNFLCSELQRDLPWENEKGMMFGKPYVLERKVCWLSTEGQTYSYGGRAHQGIVFPQDLLPVLTRLEKEMGWTFNSCLANWYTSGQQGMGWHADNESVLHPEAPIASLSLGISRKFSFKHNTTKERVDLLLEPGSLLVMDAACQRNWKHALPKQLRVVGSRINLTFRVMN